MSVHEEWLVKAENRMLPMADGAIHLLPNAGRGWVCPRLGILNVELEGVDGFAAALMALEWVPEDRMTEVPFCGLCSDEATRVLTSS